MQKAARCLGDCRSSHCFVFSLVDRVVETNGGMTSQENQAVNGRTNMQEIELKRKKRCEGCLLWRGPNRL